MHQEAVGFSSASAAPTKSFFFGFPTGCCFPLVNPFVAFEARLAVRVLTESTNRTPALEDRFRPPEGSMNGPANVLIRSSNLIPAGQVQPQTLIHVHT